MCFIIKRFFCSVFYVECPLSEVLQYASDPTIIKECIVTRKYLHDHPTSVMWSVLYLQYASDPTIEWCIVTRRYLNLLLAHSDNK